MKTLSILIAALLFSFAGMTVHELSSKSSSAPTELAKKKKKNNKNNKNRNRTKTTKIESKGLTKANELGGANSAKKMEELVNKGTSQFGYRPQPQGAAAAAAALEKMKKSKGGLNGGK